METKKDIFQEYLSAYLKATKTKKGEFLDLVCKVTKLHRIDGRQPLGALYTEVNRRLMFELGYPNQ